MELSQELISAIVATVMQKIECTAPSAATVSQGKRLLVLISGGMLGTTEALEQLRLLHNDGHQLNILFTQAGKQILGEKWLREALPGASVLPDHPEESPHALVSGADALVVPVMTFNTAAKAACGIADNPVSSVLLHGLMMGIPIVAASDACNPNHPYLTGGTVHNRIYYNRLMENVESLRRYGVSVVPAGGLYHSVCKTIGPGKSAQPEAVYSMREAETQMQFTGRVLSAEVVSGCSCRTLLAGRNTLVTLAALDVAKRRGIEIRKES